jgi:hypothetical protein
MDDPIGLCTRPHRHYVTPMSGQAGSQIVDPLLPTGWYRLVHTPADVPDNSTLLVADAYTIMATETTMAIFRRFQLAKSHFTRLYTFECVSCLMRASPPSASPCLAAASYGYVPQPAHLICLYSPGINGGKGAELLRNPVDYLVSTGSSRDEVLTAQTWCKSAT